MDDDYGILVDQGTFKQRVEGVGIDIVEIGGANANRRRLGSRSGSGLLATRRQRQEKEEKRSSVHGTSASPGTLVPRSRIRHLE
jgi:hypothetical protein